ncbi:MAG TPA: aminotransferase class V-fold PLP-dependent enzyme [Bacteroidales bacterium]|nr:aminotransferase class V-fold PLP-dependent enzyme [Bacteroidales bacterium]
MKVYLDNSATSWPKPPTVAKAITAYLDDYGASPGRSGHSMSLQAARQVFETRELLASFFNVRNSEKVIFTANATHAINIAIKGLLKKGDHVIVSNFEHNSVIRPLRYLESLGMIEITVIPADETAYFSLQKFTESIKPNTKLVVCIHGSNVCGAVMPVSHIGKLCNEKQIIFMTDAAQTSGFIPVDMQKDNIDILIFTGHKKLYGPPGIGGLCINSDLSIDTLIHGGTGSKSDEEFHPGFYPDRLEAGTINTVGIVGLKAGLEYLKEKGTDIIREHLNQLMSYFLSQLKEIDHITLYGPDSGDNRLPLVSLNVDGLLSSELALMLDRDYGILARAGLHCSPLAHKSLGTFPQGTLRLSLGCFNTEEEITYTIRAFKKITGNI